MKLFTTEKYPLLAACRSAALLCVLVGCAHNEKHFTDRAIVSPRTLAVAPVLNFSGEMSLDPVKAADLLASELSYVDGVTVLPVSRVLAVLASQGKTQIESPAHALQIADAVGADGILVAGVTEYDPYTPVVGIVLQIYTPSPAAISEFDAVAASRMSKPFSVTRMSDPRTPTSQVQAVYDGAHDNIRNAVKKFAEPRTTEESVVGWREYLKVQTLYLRFCWHEALTRLMNQEQSRNTFLAGKPGLEDPS